MASGEEYDLCSTSPPRRSDLFADLDLVQEPSIFSWKVVKRRQRSRRHNSIWGGSGGAPPAPPSTPTSLTATTTPTPSPTATITTTSTNSTVANVTAAAAAEAATTSAAEDERLNSLLYILDYAPKYKKKLKEQQRTDAELAALLNVITLSNSAGGSSIVGSKASSGIAGGGHQPPLEHRICTASRTIRKPAASTKIFKIHRNPKEFFREPEHEEDSVSAPEYDDADEHEHHTARYRRQLKRRSLVLAVRQRRFARFEQQQRMEAMTHDFGNAMTFNEV